MYFSIFFILMLVLLAAIIFFHYVQGLFSATLSAIFAVVAAILAFSYHETIVESLLAGKAANTAHAMMLLILFAVIYMTLRILSDSMIPGQVRLPAIMDKVGGAIMGLIAGIFGLGILAIGAQELPFGPSILGYDRYATADQKLSVPGTAASRGRDGFTFDELNSMEPGSFAAEDRHSAWFDDAVVNTVGFLSNGGSVGGNQPLSAVHPDYLEELFGQRLGIEPGAKRVATDLLKQHLQDVTIKALYEVNSLASADSEQKVVRPQFYAKVSKTITAGKDEVFLIVRVQFLHSASDPDSLFRFSPGSVRLYTPGDGTDQQPANYFPLGAMNATTLYADKMDDSLFVNLKDKDRGADLVFKIKKAAIFEGKSRKVMPGVFLEVKRLAREDLSGKSVTASLPPLDYDYWILRKPEVVPQPPKDGAPSPQNPPTPAPTPAPAPGPAPTPAIAPPVNPAQLHPNSPQSVVASTNQVFVFVSAEASNKLPTAIAVSADVSKLSVQLSGGDAILKANRFVSLNVDVAETTDTLKKGPRQIAELTPPPDQSLLQIEGTVPGQNWNWGEKAEQFEVADAAGKHYKANGVWALVQDGNDTKFFARYSTDYPLSAITPQEGKIVKLWFCFGVPPNVEMKQLLMGTVVLADLNGIKAAPLK